MAKIIIADCILEVEKKLKDAVDPAKKSKIKDLKKYMGTQLEFIGLSMPEQREVSKEGFSWSALSLEKQFAIWDKIWKTANNYEVMNQALFYVSKYRHELAPQELWRILKSWVNRVDNWAHSDSLSDLYAHLLELETAHVYPDLVVWNSAVNPWERRQSLISLLEYSKKRKKMLPVNKMLPLVSNLLGDKDIFVQKAVGWSLREIGNVYPAATLEFLNKHVAKLSGTAFSAATEKITAEEKSRLKKARKKNRAA